MCKYTNRGEKRLILYTYTCRSEEFCWKEKWVTCFERVLQKILKGLKYNKIDVF